MPLPIACSLTDAESQERRRNVLVRVKVREDAAMRDTGQRTEDGAKMVAVRVDT
jgi:hypothetical protein